MIVARAVCQAVNYQPNAPLSGLRVLSHMYFAGKFDTFGGASLGRYGGLFACVARDASVTEQELVIVHRRVAGPWQHVCHYAITVVRWNLAGELSCKYDVFSLWLGCVVLAKERAQSTSSSGEIYHVAVMCFICAILVYENCSVLFYKDMSHLSCFNAGRHHAPQTGPLILQSRHLTSATRLQSKANNQTSRHGPQL
jgi:hypothetical protein